MSLTLGLASHIRMQGVIRSVFALRIRAYAPSLQLHSMMEYRAVQSGDHAAAAFAAAAGVSRWASQLGAIYGNFILSSLILSGCIAHQLSGLQLPGTQIIGGVSVCLDLTRSPIYIVSATSVRNGYSVSDLHSRCVSRFNSSCVQAPCECASITKSAVWEAAVAHGRRSRCNPY
jgi:hypothetical protein